MKCVIMHWTQLAKDSPVAGSYRGAGKSLALPTSRCILFEASLVIYIYINSTNINPIMIINRIYENRDLLSL